MLVYRGLEPPYGALKHCAFDLRYGANLWIILLSRYASFKGCVTGIIEPTRLEMQHPFSRAF